jgi:hypothetical protein
MPRQLSLIFRRSYPGRTIVRTLSWNSRLHLRQATGFECCRADLAAYLTPPPRDFVP